MKHAIRSWTNSTKQWHVQSDAEILQEKSGSARIICGPDSRFLIQVAFSQTCTCKEALPSNLGSLIDLALIALTPSSFLLIKICDPLIQRTRTRMASILAILNQPICMTSQHVATQTTTLRVKHHTRGGSTATHASTSTLLFNIDSRKGGFAPRRVFHNAAGDAILEMRRFVTGNETYVGVPDEKALPTAIIAPRLTSPKDKVDVYIKNAMQDGQEVRLDVRGQDVWKRNTNVYFGDKLVMQVRFVNYATSYVPFSSNQWDIAVAEGVGLLLVSLVLLPAVSMVSDGDQATTIVVYLATPLYDNTRFQSDYGQETATSETPGSHKWTTKVNMGPLGTIIADGAAGAAG